jgi:hypothetical protein
VCPSTAELQNDVDRTKMFRQQQQRSEVHHKTLLLPHVPSGCSSLKDLLMVVNVYYNLYFAVDGFKRLSRTSVHDDVVVGVVMME